MIGQSRRRRIGVCVAVTLATAITFAPSPSGAEEDSPQFTAEPAGLSLGEEVTVTASEIAAIRQEVVSGEVAVAPAEEAEMTEDLVDAAADSGMFLDEESVDVIPLLDGDATLAVPVDTVVEEVTIELDTEGVLDASVQTASSSTSNDVTLGGPTMAKAWADNGAGNYTLKIKNGVNGQVMADAYFTWKRDKLTGDNQPNKVNYLYRRFGDIQLANLGGQPDPRTEVLRIQSFPFDSIEPDLREWNKYAPASDRTSECSEYSASFTVFGIGVSQPFTSGCGNYNMWRNVDKPSSYWMQYQGGGAGNREVGFITSWSQKQGTAGSLHDLNQIVISFPFPSPNPNMGCTQTDASATCGG